MSSFEQVSVMNVRFGNDKGDPHNIDWDRLEKQCKNIKSELQELMDALAAKNIDKTRDALCDIHVFAYGGHHLMGLNADVDMNAVVTALYTRMCATPPQLQETMEHYIAKGVKFTIFGTFPFVYLKSDRDQGDEYPQHKFLKAVGYSQPMFYKP